jgi:Short C-terminal domain/Phospholipase_D-nuclease N-terminal
MSYPLLNIFWTMFEFFAWVAWICVLIYVVMDIFRSSNLSGAAKAGWFFLVFFIPLLGVLIYLIAHGAEMRTQSARQAAAADYEYRGGYTPAHSGPPNGDASGSPAGTAGTANTAEKLQSLADARDRGTITDQEFEAEKAKILT